MTTDRHIVITGGGTGIGLAIARRLATDGAVLTLLARDRARLDEEARHLWALGARVRVAACDIRDAAAVDAAFDDAAAVHGPIHALVANAGIGGPNHPGSADRFEDLVATNLGGTYRCIRAFERHAAPETDARQVVAIASILGRIGVAGYTGYCASKAGVLGLVRAFAVEFAPRNIQVNAICPGWVETDMAWRGIDGLANALGTDRAGGLADAMKAVPLGRMSKPEDVAGLVAYLLSPDARGITGQGLDMNNGAWMG